MQSIRADSSFSVSSANLRPQAALRAVEPNSEPSPADTSFQISDGRRFEVPTDGSVLSLGRRSNNDVTFDHPRVSRHHAELRFKAGQLQVKDNQSSYKTYLNGLPLAAHKWVAVPAGANLVLGDGGPRLQFGAGQDGVQVQSVAPVPAKPEPVARQSAATLQPAPAVLLDEPVAIAPPPSPMDVEACWGVTRRTVGWAGDGPHQELVRKGMQAMDRMAPGFRQKLDGLLDQDRRPDVAARYEQLGREQMDIFKHGLLMSVPLDCVESVVGPGSLAKRLALDERMSKIYEESEALQKAEWAQQKDNRNRADDLMGTFVKKLRDNHSSYENVAERVSIEDAALRKMAEKGITPEQVKAWVNDFYHQTGLPVPAEIKFRYLDDRPRYLHESGAINIGGYFDKAICMHELAHRVEFEHPAIAQANKSWVAARCVASGFDPEQPMKLTDLCPTANYDKDEMAQLDSFVSPYVGKIYPHSATEVLSKGIEHFTDSKRMLQLYQQDPEHFFLVLGALETARRP